MWLSLVQTVNSILIAAITQTLAAVFYGNSIYVNDRYTIGILYNSCRYRNRTRRRKHWIQLYQQTKCRSNCCQLCLKEYNLFLLLIHGQLSARATSFPFTHL
jgi:hypothetical protein